MSTQKFKWQGIVSKYAYPETWRSVWQIINSVIPFFIGWYLMYRSLEVGYWLTLLLAVPTAGFMVRCFIIFHDCCHGSFFKSIKTNDRLGLVLGVLVLTPFYQWKHSHAIHHATAGDLDRRGIGDVYTMTVEEYLAAPWYKKLGYRIMRSPDIPFGATIAVTHRFPKRVGKRERSKAHQHRTYGIG
jgi:omega-6 fatty acid desaturase (delta-12 desaturase)